MNPDIQSQMKALDPDAVLADMEARRVTNPIELNSTQEQLVKLWASDDRLWTTQEAVEFNLRVFAHNILKWDTQGIKPNPSVSPCPAT